MNLPEVRPLGILAHMTFLDRIRAMVRPAPATSSPVLEPRAEEYFADPANWKPVSSSNVQEIAFFMDLASRRNILGVRFFPEGATKVSEYVYFNVPLSVYTAMFSSGSKGRFVHEQLKGRYDYKQVK